MNEGPGAAVIARHHFEQWYVIAIAAIGGAAVVAGAFDVDRRGWIAAVVGAAVIGLGALDARRRQRGEPNTRVLGEIEGPLLWAVTAWIVTRLGGAYAGDLGLVAAATIAALVVTTPPRVHVFPVLAGLALEVGLALAGRQTGAALLLHVVLYGGMIMALRALARSEAHRQRVADARAEEEVAVAETARARDFGLLTVQAPSVKGIPRLDQFSGTATAGAASLDFVDETLALMLDATRHALGASTAAVLWYDPSGNEMHLRGASTTRAALAPGPYPSGAGIAGSVGPQTDMVALAPVPAGYDGLVYATADDETAVGGVLVAAIPDPGSTSPDSGGVANRPNAAAHAGVLCVERADPRPWTEAERMVVRSLASKFSLDVAVGRRLKATDRELKTINRFCAGLHQLNGVLGLDAVAQAAIDSVRVLVRVDFAAISVVDGEIHRVIRAVGDESERLTGLQFTGDEGLVGQAIKVRHALPVSGANRPGRPIFTATDGLDDLRSLLVLPLAEEGEAPVGALTVACRDPDVFTPPRRDLLALIGDQLGTKLVLARAHEAIHEMATTDGLTGLANHRVFQQAFDNMTERMRRQPGQICLLLTDIDHFKNINDTYGHPYGDQVLKSVAWVISRAARHGDLAARYGGEEFAVLLEGSDREGGRQMAERIRADIEALDLSFEGAPVRVTLSLGVAAWPDDGEGKVEVIARADQALYGAKHGGRNRVMTWSEVSRNEPESDHQAAMTLTDAVPATGPETGET